MKTKKSGRSFILSDNSASAWAIMFETLGMPTGAACTEAHVMLEEVEAAHKLGEVKETTRRKT